MRLSHLDFDALNKAIVELYEPTDFDGFKQRLLRLAARLIPNDYCIWNRYVFGPEPRLESYIESTPRITTEWIAEAGRLIFNHPYTNYFLKTNDPTALKMTDFMSRRQFRDSFLFPMHKQVGGIYHLAVTTNPPGPALGALGLGRMTRDFTERDRLILNLLRPHLIQASRITELLGSRAKEIELARSPAALREHFGLSERESEVAHWVAEGKTNPEIAMILGTSPRTIEKHMEKVLEKLRVENRTAAAVLLNGPWQVPWSAHST